MNLAKSIGLNTITSPYPDAQTVQYLNLKLASIGVPTVPTGADSDLHELAAALLLRSREMNRLLADYLCPADRRIQDFLDAYLGADERVQLPGNTLTLDRHGLARTLSLPARSDQFSSAVISSYRIKQGVLHNPKSDRRTTQGVFHIAEGGFPIPDDKRAAPRATFSRLFSLAFQPPRESMRLPFTSEEPEPAECFVSLLLRPTVCPEAPGFTSRKSNEVRFFVPGNLVSNLDFVESIFGNAGDPYLPENDAGLDVEHWTGHTGCVVLAPHLIHTTKKDAGLPHWDQATERQRRDSMCWRSEDELYNDGQAFKITCRDERGVMVTLIADSYFGYCKKEVKTQISFAANLFGLAEEEHAGGAIAFPSYDLGEEFSGHLHVRRMDHSYEEVIRLYGERMIVKPEGYAIDKNYPDILYVSEDVHFDLHRQKLSWPFRGETRSMKLLAGTTYVRPSGYKIRMEKPPGRRAWRLIGSVAEGVFCHKPSTVSGGGKSEISKSIADAVIQGPVFVADFKKDFDWVEDLIHHDYSGRFKDKSRQDSRSVLSPKRSLGSVIKLLTPAHRDFSEEYNAWLSSIPQYIKELVFVVKRFYQPSWDDRWREHFSVDIIDGIPANELKLDNRKLVSNYLRVGFERDGSWRTFGLRKDFHASSKLALEDDISATVVVPAERCPGLNPHQRNPSVKFAVNCEYRLFQRPDDAIHRGYDKQTEADLARPDNLLSNFEPLTPAQAVELTQDSIGFDEFTPVMREFIASYAQSGRPDYFVSSAQPRIVNGVPSKNPRYLQIRPDLLNPRETYLVEMATRLHRRIPLDQPVPMPVNAVVPGRRNNPPDPVAGIRPLALFNPIHYLELPELFMEFICSMTGKSPSTTGAGSEGALTKGPFNALPPIVDLNNALVAYILTEYPVFITGAGCIGPHMRVDHDISLLIPEIWGRMTLEERDPKYLIENGFLAKCEDVEHEGEILPFSRLGYRITSRFVRAFVGRIFNHPHVVITKEMLVPELQDRDVFIDGLKNVVETQRRVARMYFSDGSIEWACPPLRALLRIMVDDAGDGRDLKDPEFRRMFTRAHLLESDWYAERLRAKQAIDERLWSRHVQSLTNFGERSGYQEESQRLGIDQRLQRARTELDAIRSPEYIRGLVGSLGADPAPWRAAPAN